MVAADHDRRRDGTAPYELVDREAGARAGAEAEPADTRGKPLERDALGASASQRRAADRRGRAPAAPVDGLDVAASPDSAAQRNGPMPRQKSGRI